MVSGLESRPVLMVSFGSTSATSLGENNGEKPNEGGRSLFPWWHQGLRRPAGWTASLPGVLLACFRFFQFSANIIFFSFVLFIVHVLHDKCDISLQQTADSLPVRLWQLFHCWLCMFTLFLHHPLIKPPDRRCLPHLSAVCPNNPPVLKPTWENWIWGGSLFERDLNGAAAPVVKPQRRRYTAAQCVVVYFPAAYSVLQRVSSDRLRSSFKITLTSADSLLPDTFRYKNFTLLLFEDKYEYYWGRSSPAAPSAQIHIFYLLPSESKLPRGHF